MGRQVLFTLTRQGKPLPFGTTVTLVQEKSGSDAQGQRMGIAGDGGQVYMSGMPASGILSVAWGEGAEGQCRIPYQLTAADMAAADAERLPVIQQGECP